MFDIMIFYIGISYLTGVFSLLIFGLALECDDVLDNIYKFIVFQQLAIYKLTKEHINTVGMVILIVLSTVLLLPYTILLSAIFLVGTIIYGLSMLFYKIFKRRTE